TPREFAFADLASLPGQIPDVAALVPGREGGAVALRSVLDAVGASAAATLVTLESADGKFAQQAPLAALQSAVLVYRLGDRRCRRREAAPFASSSRTSTNATSAASIAARTSRRSPASGSSEARISDPRVRPRGICRARTLALQSRDRRRGAL